jgi:hypothetical protein
MTTRCHCNPSKNLPFTATFCHSRRAELSSRTRCRHARQNTLPATVSAAKRCLVRLLARLRLCPVTLTVGLNITRYHLRD